MVNALIISDNIHFIKKLLDEVSNKNLNLTFSKISTSKLETIQILNEFTPHIIFLDESVQKKYEGTFFYNYKSIVITLFYSKSSNLLHSRTLKEIHKLIEDIDFNKRRNKIIKELEYIGYKFKYKGTNYLLDTILQIDSKRNSMIDNLQGCIYPIVARKYGKTVYNIKSSINKATDCMYYECDAKRLDDYFKLGNDIKPTIKQVVFTIANKI